MLSSADNIGTGSIEHISANGLGACFAVDMSLASEPSEYICYACCPESACKDMTPAEDDSQGHVSLAFTVPTRQMPQVFDMRFTSVVAYGKLTIMDLPKEPDERVVSVTLRASQPLTGQAVYRSGSEATAVCAATDASNDLEIEFHYGSPAFRPRSAAGSCASASRQTEGATRSLSIYRTRNFRWSGTASCRSR